MTEELDDVCKTCREQEFHDKHYGHGAGVWAQKRLEEQGGKCGMCGGGGFDDCFWHIDRDTETGAWKEVLCMACDFGLDLIRTGGNLDYFLEVADRGRKAYMEKNA